ncbi:hypothetical protein PIB30_028017 [Stylosanthes scabra]|uniref:Uncharacterized protein n=1 Tax=Stylosanthes scabra TaxID=79078 RepID=A0ABU6YAY6_9FABA|nr:hypothetical protein [Stylosanthes scabra]
MAAEQHLPDRTGSKGIMVPDSRSIVGIAKSSSEILTSSKLETEKGQLDSFTDADEGGVVGDEALADAETQARRTIVTLTFSLDLDLKKRELTFRYENQQGWDDTSTSAEQRKKLAEKKPCRERTDGENQGGVEDPEGSDLWRQEEEEWLG